MPLLLTILPGVPPSYNNVDIDLNVNFNASACVVVMTTISQP